jgi:hypothetical protein
MRKIVLSSSLIIALAMVGCGSNRFGTPPVQQIAVKSATLDSDTNIITTTDDYTTITLVGEFGSKVFINDKEVGTFPESGSLEVTFDIAEVGNYKYNIYSTNLGGDSQTITIKIVKKQKSASLGNVQTAGKANNLTASKDGIIFIAEKSHGVEVISIGYDDKVVSVLLSTINDIDAQNVILSQDENRLFIEDETGKFHVLDISDVKNPIKIELIDEITKSLSVISEDSSTKFSVNNCGLISEDISNPAKPTQNFFLKDTKIQDVILVDNDTKILVAHGEEGLQLFDVSDKSKPLMIGSQNLNGNTSGLSLLKKDGVLFVANGASGVEIFDLSILLFEMIRDIDINKEI